MFEEGYSVQIAFTNNTVERERSVLEDIISREDVVGIIVTAVVLLMRRFPRHGLIVFGGAFIVLGAYMPFLERFINMTFHKDRYAAWSQYPLVSLVLLGALLIFLGANARARHVLEEKFFL